MYSLGIDNMSGGRLPNLKGHSELQSIHFEIALAGLVVNDYWDEPLAWITDVLDTLSPSTPLKQVYIDVEVSFQNPARPFQIDTWWRLDTLLTSADFARAPCGLTIQLVPTAFPAGHDNLRMMVYETIRGGILVGLPQLLSKNLVVVECMSRTLY